MYTNGQQTNSQADIWANQQRVQLVRFSKVRNDNDGKPTRGCLIRNEQGDERWVSMQSSGGFFREVQWGQHIWYYGHGVKPPLGTMAIESKTPDARELINQSKADYYARIAEANKPEPIDWNQPSHASPEADDVLIEQISGTLSKFVLMTQGLNPQLSEESVIKLAISGYIQYTKQKEQMPY